MHILALHDCETLPKEFVLICTCQRSLRDTFEAERVELKGIHHGLVMPSSLIGRIQLIKLSHLSVMGLHKSLLLDSLQTKTPTGLKRLAVIRRNLFKSPCQSSGISFVPLQRLGTNWLFHNSRSHRVKDPEARQDSKDPDQNGQPFCGKNALHPGKGLATPRDDGILRTWHYNHTRYDAMPPANHRGTIRKADHILHLDGIVDLVVAATPDIPVMTFRNRHMDKDPSHAAAYRAAVRRRYLVDLLPRYVESGHALVFVLPGGNEVVGLAVWSYHNASRDGELGSGDVCVGREELAALKDRVKREGRSRRKHGAAAVEGQEEEEEEDENKEDEDKGDEDKEDEDKEDEEEAEARDGFRDAVFKVYNARCQEALAKGGSQSMMLWLRMLCVHPAHRGKGIGSALVEEGIRLQRGGGDTRWVALYSSSETAARLYRRLGFRDHGGFEIKLGDLDDVDGEEGLKVRVMAKRIFQGESMVGLQGVELINPCKVHIPTSSQLREWGVTDWDSLVVEGLPWDGVVSQIKLRQ